MTMYGTPERVEWCARCVVSNQRPSSVVERDAKPEDQKPTIAFHDGVCSACLYVEQKQRIDWAAREQRLRDLCDKHRWRKPYNVVVPGSGGKDSMYVAHMLKHRYGMTPVTVTGAPILPTESGRRNFDAWRRIADNVLLTPHDYPARVRDSFLRFCHPFKSFIEEQVAAGPTLARQLGIPLVMYGEPRAERGNDIAETETPLMDRRFYPDGTPADVEVHYFGWYHYWRTQANYYYAVDHCGFRPNTERTSGTYSRMNSFDDAIDDLHYATTLAKFGIGRATYNAVDDIRDGYLSREDAVALVKRYELEPPRHLAECLEYMGLTLAEYTDRVDAARPEHLWHKVDGAWALRHSVWA